MNRHRFSDGPGYDVAVPTMRGHDRWLDEPALPAEQMVTPRPAWPLLDPDDTSRLPILQRVLDGLYAL